MSIFFSAKIRKSSVAEVLRKKAILFVHTVKPPVHAPRDYTSSPSFSTNSLLGNMLSWLQIASNLQNSKPFDIWLLSALAWENLPWAFCAAAVTSFMGKMELTVWGLCVLQAAARPALAYTTQCVSRLTGDRGWDMGERWQRILQPFAACPGDAFPLHQVTMI